MLRLCYCSTKLVDPKQIGLIFHGAPCCSIASLRKAGHATDRKDRRRAELALGPALRIDIGGLYLVEEDGDRCLGKIPKNAATAAALTGRVDQPGRATALGQRLQGKKG